MNFIKKAVMFSFALALTPATLYGRELNRDLRRPDRGSSSSEYRLQIEHMDRYEVLNVADCLIQIGSIYSIDSTQSVAVDLLAKIRALINGLYVLKNGVLLWESGKALLEADPYLLTALANVCLRSKNIEKDYNIWQASASVAGANGRHNGDKNLENKKYCQYAWLAVNKLLPKVMGRLLQSNIAHDNYSLFASISELYRQKLMYAMIAKK